MRIIKKTLAILIGLMLTVWLVLQLPFILIFELHKHDVKCKKNLFIEMMDSVNSYLIDLVSALWEKKEFEFAMVYPK